MTICRTPLVAIRSKVLSNIVLQSLLIRRRTIQEIEVEDEQFKWQTIGIIETSHMQTREIILMILNVGKLVDDPYYGNPSLRKEQVFDELEHEGHVLASSALLSSSYSGSIMGLVYANAIQHVADQRLIKLVGEHSSTNEFPQWVKEYPAWKFKLGRNAEGFPAEEGQL